MSEKLIIQTEDDHLRVVRVSSIFLENSVIGGGYFVLEAAKALRALADKLESGEADCMTFFFVTDAGTRVTVNSGPYWQHAESGDVVTLEEMRANPRR